MKIGKREILDLSIEYVLSLANNKPFNVQMMGIVNKYKNKSLIEDEKFLLSFDDFQKRGEILLCKDFVYKNDFSTFRNFYIIDPDTYIFYTYQVFMIYFSIFNKEEPFDNTNLKVFYSGKIKYSNNSKVIKNHSSFNKEYQRFKELSKTYKGNEVLTIDLQNFFDSINLEKLYFKIKELLNNEKVGLEALNNLKSLFQHLRFEGLPQIHFSIASSVLSQLYLMELSEEINELMMLNGWEGARFVDDFYINLKDKHTDKDVNLFLQNISQKLFQEGLNLNFNKTQKLSIEDFKEKISTIRDSYDNFEEHLNYQYFDAPYEISQKAEELLSNNGEKFIKFISEVNSLFVQSGLDLKKYKVLQNEHLSINNEDASKVMKQIIFSKKWKSLISKNRLLHILERLEVVYFDPINFATLFAMMYDFLQSNKGDDEEYKINFTVDFKKHYHSPIRLLIIYQQLIVQRKIDKKEFITLKNKFKKVDPKLCEYMEVYIF